MDRHGCKRMCLEVMKAVPRYDRFKNSKIIERFFSIEGKSFITINFCPLDISCPEEQRAGVMVCEEMNNFRTIDDTYLFCSTATQFV